MSDPSAFEEPLLDNTVTIIVDENGRLTTVLQSGLVPMDLEIHLSHCISAAKKRRKELAEVVDRL